MRTGQERRYGCQRRDSRSRSSMDHGWKARESRGDRQSNKRRREERRGSSDRIRWPDSLSCSRCCNHSSGCDQAPGVKTVPKTSIRVKGKVKSNHPPPAHETRKGEAPLSLSFTLRERERETLTVTHQERTFTHSLPVRHQRQQTTRGRTERPGSRGIQFKHHLKSRFVRRLR